MVDVSLCGLCGSDAEKLTEGRSRPGLVLGHEVVGWLRKPGDAPVRVALAHHVPCGVCALCRRGHSSLCARFRESRLDPGGFAERLAVTRAHLENAVFPLPDEIGDLAGTLLEPLSCVLRAVETATGLLGGYPLPDVLYGAAAAEGRHGQGGAGGPQEDHAFDGPTPAGTVLPPGIDPSSDVLVAGCGSVGLLFLSVLAAARNGSVPWRTFGSGGLLSLDPNPGRTHLAAELGATEWDGSVAPRVAFVTAAAALPRVVRGMGPGGLIVVFAGATAVPPLDVDRIYRGELTLAGVRSGSQRHLRQSMAALQAKVLPLDWYRPEVVGLEGLPKAVERYAQGEVLKVVLRP